jgi:unsaturated rhamnogalacturonyl hydrolase
LYHAQDESRAQKWADPVSGRSSWFWGRAMGWYVMAIVDVLDYLPKNHPERDQILDIYKKTIDALLEVRDKDSGAWYQIVNLPDHKGNYLEGSATAMYTYAIAKGAKKGYLDQKYLEIANNCFDSLLKVFIKEDDKGKLTMVNICGGAGLGGIPYRDGSFEYYVSEQIVPNDCKGVAPFIYAAIELNR